MIILDSTSDSLEIYLGGAVSTSEPPFVVSYVDHTTSSFTPGKNKGATSGTTPVTIVAAPAASTQRQLKFLSILNIDSAPVTVHLRLNAGSPTRIITVTLAVGDALIYTDGEGFRIYDSNGAIKQVPAIGGLTPNAVTPGTADTAIVSATPNLRLIGVNIRETAAAAAALSLKHGTGAGDPELLGWNLAANESVYISFGEEGIKAPNGIYLDRHTGTTSLVLYTKVLP